MIFGRKASDEILFRIENFQLTPRAPETGGNNQSSRHSEDFRPLVPPGGSGVPVNESLSTRTAVAGR